MDPTTAAPPPKTAPDPTEDRPSWAQLVIQSPMTSALALSWVAIYVAMIVNQSGASNPRALLWGGMILPETSHRFGDVTPIAIYGGQLYRALTATFIHFNLLHLVLNMVFFVQLGWGMERWYGARQFLALYVATGIGANLLANLLRPWLDPEGLMIHSGGGSTVVLGFLALVTVVGWRHPQEFPIRLRIWLVVILGINMGLGWLIPHVDNLGHLSGVVVGSFFGLLDHFLQYRARSRTAWLAAIVGVLLLIGSTAALIRQNNAEEIAQAYVKRRATVLRDLTELNLIYLAIADRSLGRAGIELIPPKSPNLHGLPILVLREDPSVLERGREQLKLALGRYRDKSSDLAQPPTAEADEIVRGLAARSLSKLPDAEEVSSFRESTGVLFQRLGNEILAARNTLNRLKNPPPIILQKAIEDLLPAENQRRIVLPPN